MKKIKTLFFTTCLLFGIVMSSLAQKEVNKTFSFKEKIKISTVSGNCKIKEGTTNDIQVHLLYTYSDDCFEYIFKEESNYLRIAEDFHGNNCHGKSEWTITVPSNVSIKFNSASGDLVLNKVDNSVYANTASGDIVVKNVGSEIDITTASGDIVLENINGNSEITSASGDVIASSCKDGLSISTASGNIRTQDIHGNIEITTASGDLDISNAIGKFTLKAASGKVNAENIELTEESYFTSASGDVNVILAKSAEHSLKISSASGNSVLDYNGNEIKGYFEFSARVDKGDIISPIKFDKEEVIEKSGKDYDLKSFTAGSNSPKIIIKTASGNAQLKK